MTLTVVLNAHLSKLASEKEKILTFHDSITVFQVLERLGIDPEEVSVASFEGIRIDGETPIRTEGVLHLFPSIIGG